MSQDKLHTQVEQLILSNSIQFSFEKLINRATELGQSMIKDDLDSQKRVYTQMLHYTFRNAEDPQRAEILKKLKIRLLEINDELRERLFESDTSRALSNEKKNILRKTTQSRQYIEDLKALTGDPESPERKQKMQAVFSLIWFTDKLSESELDAITKCVKSSNTEFYEKSLIISALTMSLLRYFDLKKFTALFNAYDINGKYIWNRAFVGLIIAFYVYNSRVSLYDELQDRLEQISDDKGMERYLEQVLLQLIRTRETEKISEKLRNEIIPEMTKFRPEIEQKLDLDKILSDKLIEDKNPEWEEVFKDSSDLLGKMEEMSKMQLEGSDVFMSAFSELKHFSFFNESANWFLPFYKENQDVKNVFADEPEEFDSEVFTGGLQKSGYICNSDKYSFCLNIEMMPKAQKEMILNLFKMELEAMDEVASEDKILDSKNDDKFIFTRTIQDIYRFFKLSRFKNDLPDFFNSKLDIHNTLFFKIVNKDESVLRKIAEFYLKKNYYSEAAETFLLLSKEEKSIKRTYEKVAFAYQKMKSYKTALKYYKRAEFFNADTVWLNKKLGFCYRKLGDYDNALLYYKKAKDQQPENLHVIANIGHCYLSDEKFEKALKAYFKVEYFDPENIRVKRPLAWCSFVLGKLDSAEKYLSKLIEMKPTAHDYINLGHVLFCKNKKSEALEFYKKATQSLNYDKVKESILNDKSHMLKNGSSEAEIYLLLDYLLINLEN
ncbi:MAG: tetratricopeptide repeat protein [Bacteroidota bacterium]|nr:tetratricopeptide repeat protein [Bacteroidota bacterium]